MFHLAGVPDLSRRRLRQGFVILTYHSFFRDRRADWRGTMDIRLLERQLKYLRRRFTLVPLGELVRGLQEGRLPETPAKIPLAAITVDDGYSDNYELLFPLLQREQVPATVFLSTDFLDTGRPPWAVRIREIITKTRAPKLTSPLALPLTTPAGRDRACRLLKETLAPMEPLARLKTVEEIAAELAVEPGSQCVPLTWAQVRQMAAGGVEFGSHTVYHSILTAVSEKICRQELNESRERIEAELGPTVTLFCYPNGNHDPRTEALVRSAGYQGAVTQEPGLNTTGSQPLALRRIHIPHNESLGTFACRATMVPQALGRIAGKPSGIRA